jgi:uncharacterized protein (DUF2249 family)/uncharacterized protein YjiS (DUF1127 family)
MDNTIWLNPSHSSRVRRGPFRRGLDRLLHAITTLAEGVEEARRMHRAYDQLARMNDYELADIGLVRGDIPAAVVGRFRRNDIGALANVVTIAQRKRPLSPGPIQRGGRRSKLMCNPSEDSVDDEVDVRSLPPAQRHAKIFELVNELGPGTSFVLVNDHDPKPLYYQLEAEYPKQFSWTYLERGPAAWRVEIGRYAQAA